MSTDRQTDSGADQGVTPEQRAGIRKTVLVVVVFVVIVFAWSIISRLIQ